MRSGRIKKILVVGVLAFAVVGGSALGVMRWKIQSSLDDHCATAQTAHPHPGDPVAALMAYVESKAHSLPERNRTVWALGQARDQRATVVLEQFVTGGKCDHSQNLCQHELDKAMKLCRGQTPNLLGIKVRSPK